MLLRFRAVTARKYMGQFGHRRVENELAWHHEVPNLLAAYQALGCAARDLPAPQGAQVR